jgi:hypothetical protein
MKLRHLGFGAALALVGTLANAQVNEDFVNQEIQTGTEYTSLFSVNSDSELITGSTTPAAGITGNVVITSLTSGSIVASDLNFAAGDLSGHNYDFLFNGLKAGTYLLGYEFTSLTSAVQNVGFAASTIPSPTMAPEIHADSAVAALTMLGFGLVIITGGRKRGGNELVASP